jgi:hypothetical protein
MSGTLSLGAARAEAGARLGLFRRVLAINLGIAALLGLAALLFPGTLAGVLGLGPVTPRGLLRAWGVLLLVLAALHLPAWLDPVRERWTVLVGLAARVLLALVYLPLGGGFLLLALGEAGFAAALGVLYWRAGIAVLMSRP